MAELIDRQALIKRLKIWDTPDTMDKILYNFALNRALEMPTIEAEPIKRGQWIKNDDRSGWHCSCCGKDDLYAYPYTQNNERELQDFYCPNCGARMDGGIIHFAKDYDRPIKSFEVTYKFKEEEE